MEEECLLPQLGSGSNGCKLGCGFYTVEDYKEILRYANARHIEVIPEIDMPGHCRAGIKAMEARYRKYMNYGNETAAREFLLTDFADKTQYLSVQLFTDNAINICMDSTKVFIRYIIRAIKEMHSDIQPLKVYHFGGIYQVCDSNSDGFDFMKKRFFTLHNSLIIHVVFLVLIFLTCTYNISVLSVNFR